MHNPAADRIRIIIPTPLKTYAAHYRKRASEGVITPAQAEALIDMLTIVKRRGEQSLITMNHSVLNETTYYDRNTRVLDGADQLLAFQVNDSLGTQDTIDKARRQGLAVDVKRYAIAD